MPCAPNLTARAESSPVSELARTPSRRRASAWVMIRCTALTSSSAPGSRLPSKYSTTGEATTGTSPRYTAPDVPSIEITSPSRTTTWPLPLPGAVNCRAFTSTSSASAPHTQVLPMPRATTAAWLVLPPRLVRMPWAAIMPCRSSGLVSRRTRITSSPRSAHSTAVAESKTALPTAAPGDALIALAISVAFSLSPNRGNISWASCAPVTRRSASSMSIRPWSTSWIAIRNAAPAVRLPTRVCSIHSLPRSIVNSMSHRSL